MARREWLASTAAARLLKADDSAWALLSKELHSFRSVEADCPSSPGWQIKSLEQLFGEKEND